MSFLNLSLQEKNMLHELIGAVTQQKVDKFR